MLRPPNPVAETMVRLFVIAIVVALIIILLSSYHTSDAVAGLNEAIRAVDGTLVSKYLNEMNVTGLPREFKLGQHPLYVVTTIPEDETAEAQEIVRQVAYTFRTVPIDVDYAHHPLTAAYRHHRVKVAKILLEVWRQFPPNTGSPMSEVYASALSIADMRLLDPSVFVYCEARDFPRCRSVVDATRLHSTPTSQLEGAYLLRHNAPQTPPLRIPFVDTDMPPRVVAPISTIRAGLWNDPFRPPLPGLLPPHGEFIMHPGYFSDPGDQFLYMVFGHVEGSMALTGFMFFALAVTVLCLGSWAVGIGVWLWRRA